IDCRGLPIGRRAGSAIVVRSVLRPGPRRTAERSARDHVIQPQLAKPHGPGRRRVSREPGRRRRVGARWLHGAAERARSEVESRGVRGLVKNAPTSQAQIADSIGVPVARRHIFLCCDQTNPKCCEKERGLAAWDFLKRRLKELGLSEQGGVLRSKVNCFRICEGGPIAVVYPEGAWYGQCDP